MADRACTRSSGRVEDRLVVSPSVQTPIRMTSFFLLIVVALLLFISTNVDDIFVLVGFFADRRYRSQDIVVGQFVEIGYCSQRVLRLHCFRLQSEILPWLSRDCSGHHRFQRALESLCKHCGIGGSRRASSRRDCVGEDRIGCTHHDFEWRR
jgi:hypothetical protein